MIRVYDVILYARDPGGVNVIAPLYYAIKQRGYKIKLFSKDMGIKRFQSLECPVQDIMQIINDVSIEEINQLLKKYKPKCIITATSADDFVEKYLWNSGKTLNIYTIAVLDQWMNFRVRFSNYSVNQINNSTNKEKLIFIPECIMVIDRYCQDELIKIGIPKENIIITGQPHFLSVYNKAKELKKVDVRGKIRNHLGISPNDYVVTYASEPFAEVYKVEDVNKSYWGYTEISNFKVLYEALYQVEEKIKEDIVLVIKIHPKESDNKYNKIIENLSKKIKIIIDKTTDALEMISASDLVCGMSSMLLVEAAIIGTQVMSIQINLKQKNPFILADLYPIPLITDNSKVYDALVEIYGQKMQNIKIVDEKTIERIISFVEARI